MICSAQSGIFAAVWERATTLTSAMAAVGIAVGGTSLICYVLTARARKRNARRGTSRDGSGSDGGNYTGGDG